MYGILASTDSNIIKHQENITFILNRRGTNDTVWYQDTNGYVFAHTLPITRGKEPLKQLIIDNEGILLFTGELWNVPSNEPDALVFLQRIRTYGLSHAIKNTHGNWAFVYWDNKNKYLSFATDEVGEQPLHYAYLNENIYVASEIKILVSAGVPLRFIHHVRPCNLYRLKGGLQISPTRLLTARNRWNSFNPDILHQRIAKAVKEKTTSVDLQRIGLLISGGIDSTIIAYEASLLGIRRAWTIVADPNSIDAVRARIIADKFNLDWTLIIAQPRSPEIGIIMGEVSNRSIVEELCLHVILAQLISKDGIRVVLTGTGADEVFIGYSHLLGRVHKTLLQERFLLSLYRYDLRAFNKVFMGYGVKVRNPFLSRDVIIYALQLHADILLGPSRILKWPLRLAYGDLLGHLDNQQVLIARETMGVKRIFEEKFGSSPYIYRKVWQQVLKDHNEITKWLQEADQFNGVVDIR